MARLTRNDFDLCCNTTIGVEYSSRDLIDQDENIIRLQIWDPIVGERFTRIQRPYYRCAVAALLVFDVCRRSSMEELDRLILEAKQHTSEHTAYIAVANKVDLVRLREISH
jgi:GTPase SAR1 family protein